MSSADGKASAAPAEAAREEPRSARAEDADAAGPSEIMQFAEQAGIALDVESVNILLSELMSMNAVRRRAIATSPSFVLHVHVDRTLHVAMPCHVL